jgi:putative hydrolase
LAYYSIVTDSDPFDESNSFGGLPFFGDLSKMFQSQGPVAWDAAKEFAKQLATDGEAEPNVEPIDRISIEELTRVAELQVAKITNLDSSQSGKPVKIEVVTRNEWAQETLVAHRDLTELLATQLSAPPTTSADNNLEAQMLGGLFKFLNPMMIAMAAGSMAGHLATHSFGNYGLPIPRSGNKIFIIDRNIKEFADEWTLEVTDIRLWVLIQELTMHSILSRPHVADSIMSLLSKYVKGFHHNPHSLQEKFENLDLSGSDPSQIQSQLESALGDPDTLLGAMRSDEQASVVPDLETLLSVVVAYTDYVIQESCTQLIASYTSLVEVFHRRRVTADTSDRFVEKLFGVNLRIELIEQGQLFINGVIERAGRDGLEQLWTERRNLPTPNELLAPGLWLARIELPD